MKHFTFKAIGLLALLFACSLLHAQNGNVSTPKADPMTQLATDPAGYDAAKEKWVATHPQEYKAMEQSNARVSDQAMPWGAPENKEAWIKANPAEYAKMSANTDNRQRISKAQFEAYPAEKQAAITNDPNFIIED